MGGIGTFQRRHADAQQPKAPLQVHPLQTAAGQPSYVAGVLGGRLCRQLARHGAEIRVAQLDAHRAAPIALALQILRRLLGQPREDGSQLGTVVHGMQVNPEDMDSLSEHPLT